MSERVMRSAAVSDASGGRRLNPSEFATRFEGAWSTLWYVAAAVLNDRAAADDVLQESAMIALGKLDKFDPASNFTAWMATIVRFVALNHARRRVRLAENAADIGGLEIATTKGQPQATGPVLTGRGQLAGQQDEFDERVLNALQGLDETARACLLLRTMMDMPYREISLALDIAEGTAMSHVHRARMALRKTLGAAFALTGSLHPLEGHGHAH